MSSIIDPKDFEEKIDSPDLEDPETLPVITQHLAEVSDAIEKCEKILQHLAIGNYSDDFQNYMSQHIQLISKRNKLIKQLREMEQDQEKKNLETKEFRDR